MKIVLSILLGLLTFIFLLAAVAVYIIQPPGIIKMIENVDLYQIVEETGLSGEILTGIQQTQYRDLIDDDGLESFLQRENVSDEVGRLLSKYIDAAADGDYDFYLSENDVMSSVRTISPDIYEVFGYTITDEDYRLIRESLNTEVNLSEYNAGSILSDTGIDIAAFKLIFSAYLLCILVILCALAVYNIFMLQRRDIKRALLISGIPFATAGLIYTAAGLLTGPLSGLLSIEVNGINVIEIISETYGLILVPGIIVLAAGVLMIAAFIVLKKYRKVEEQPATEPSKTHIGIYIAWPAANIVCIAACVALALLRIT